MDTLIGTEKILDVYYEWIQGEDVCGVAVKRTLDWFIGGKKGGVEV